MKKYCVFVIAISFTAVTSFAQVGINSDNSAPDLSAMLDVKSYEKGVLLPRLTQTQVSQIADPADGLIVFCTTDSKVYIFLASFGQWKEIAIGAGFINLPFQCGQDLTINHLTTSGVSPVDKSTLYGTVTNIP